MIRSSKVNLKFANTGKKNQLAEFLDEYKRVMAQFVDILWPMKKIQPLLPKATLELVTDSWLSARAIKEAGKQTSGIVRGCKKKQQQAEYRIKQLNKEGKFKQARRLAAIYEKKIAGKPVIDRIEAELNAQFIKGIALDHPNSFDGWVTLWTLGKKMQIAIPFKCHKHFRKMLERGKIKGGVRVSKEGMTFMFEIPNPVAVATGKTLGIDIGMRNALSCSDGQVINEDAHGHNYESICEKLARKKKGSIGFKKADKHRTNYLHWVVNKLELNGVRQVNIEKIRGMRVGKRTSRYLSHFNYWLLFQVIKGKVPEAGVAVEERCPTYTSQRCGECGWTCKRNRKGSQFKCAKCGHTCNADLNAAFNISLNLPEISKEDRLSKINRQGFYWLAIGQELSVPDVQETDCI